MAAKISNTFLCVFLLFLFHSNQSHANLHGNNQEKPSPFDFLNKLHGCRKGDNIEGIHKLKIYLQTFGYLIYDQNSKTGGSTDVFDDLLESALKTYQLNYNLNVTGVLDASTVSTMMMPRCGVPDIINGTTRMRSGTIRTQHHGPNFLQIVSHYAFFPGNRKWTKFDLTYALLPGTRGDASDPVHRAFLKWTSVSPFAFTVTTDYDHADLKISFQRGNHGDGAPFDGLGGVLAHAFIPTDGRFHYDADDVWVDGPVPGGFDLETTALHEIGHLLGLAHSSVHNAIMFPSINPGVVKGLDDDDIQGLRVLYS